MNSKTNITNPESVLEECSNVKVKYTKYTEYGKMLESHIENIRSIVSKSDSGEAAVSIRNIANIMDMNDKSDTAIYNGTKYIMWQHNIAVDLGIHRDGISKLLIFRDPINGEKLPDSLIRNKADDLKYRNKLAKKRGCKDYNEYRSKVNHENRVYIPFNENKECPAYLGVHIAERVLPLIFENVERMSYGNHGYDFICDRGHKIDVKSSSLRTNNRWTFGIRENKVADYFLMIAFDNRYNLNIVHIWLIKGNEAIRLRKLNDRINLVVINSMKYLIKLKRYEITDKLDDIQKVCNEFREAN